MTQVRPQPPQADLGSNRGELRLDVSAQGTARVVGALISALILLYALSQALGIGRRLLNLDEEQSIPTFASVVLLLTAAGLLLVVAALKQQRGDAFRRYWWGLAAAFVALAADESASVHEAVGRRLSELPGLDSRLGYGWLLSALALLTLFALFAILYVRFWLHLPRRWRLLFAGSALLYLGGAVGADLLSGFLSEFSGRSGAAYRVAVGVEEGGELLGVGLFIYALVSYLEAHTSGVVVRFGARRPPV